MILRDDCTERSLLAIEVRSAEMETCIMRLSLTLLGYQFSMGHVTSSYQGLSSAIIQSASYNNHSNFSL